MVTKSIHILNLNVPCQNFCKYCLLSYDGKTLGIDYERSIKYAKSFYHWLKENRPDLGFTYYFGYSMEHPHLFEVIKFMQETHSPSGRFLQFNGMKIRNDSELNEFMLCLKNIGIETLDFTFYGTEEYHDKFSARKGDYVWMMRALNEALKKGLQVQVEIPVTKENLQQMDALVDVFSCKNVQIRLFTPHSGGRGACLFSQKITIEDYEGMHEKNKIYFNRNANKTPWEWAQNPPKEVEFRTLTLSLTPSNIQQLEKQLFEETLLDLERMDEKYFSVIPSFFALLKRYADDKDNRLYSKKDLYFLYRARYIQENNLNIVDITDERFHSSVRY